MATNFQKILIKDLDQLDLFSAEHRSLEVNL